MYSIIPEAYDIQGFKYLTFTVAYTGDEVMQLTRKNTRECSSIRVAILYYINLDLDFWWWSRLF